MSIKKPLGVGGWGGSEQHWSFGPMERITCLVCLLWSPRANEPDIFPLNWKKQQQSLTGLNPKLRLSQQTLSFQKTKKKHAQIMRTVFDVQEHGYSIHSDAWGRTPLKVIWNTCTPPKHHPLEISQSQKDYSPLVKSLVLLEPPSQHKANCSLTGDLPQLSRTTLLSPCLPCFQIFLS